MCAFPTKYDNTNIPIGKFQNDDLNPILVCVCVCERERKNGELLYNIKSGKLDVKTTIESISKVEANLDMVNQHQRFKLKIPTPN